MGVLQALDEHGLSPDYMAGTSIGALVAALYAFGVSPSDIRTLASRMRWQDIRAYTLSKFGLLSNQEIANIVVKEIGEVRLEDSPIPLAVIAADISTGEPVVLREGDVATAIMASTCMPGYYIPVEIDGRLLVDGGIITNVPVSTLPPMGAAVTVAIDLNASRVYHRPRNLFDVLSNAFSMAMGANTRLETQHADVTIAPDLHTYESPDSGDVRALFAEGYRAAVLAVREIRAAIDARAPSSRKRLEQRFRRWRTKTGES